MRITDVQVHLMSSVMRRPVQFPFLGGRRTIHKRDAMLIKVTTDSGLVGYGSGPATERIARQIDDMIRPALIGLDHDKLDPMRERILSQAGADTRIAYGAVETALYDLLGKMQDKPISELLGGRVRDSIRLYACGGMYKPAEDCAEEAVAVKNMGFEGFKMRLAGGPPADLEAVAAVRRATGPDFNIMVEAHSWWRLGEHSYTYEMVSSLAQRMMPHRLTWLEEPFRPENRDAYARLKLEGTVPIAAGESESDMDGFMTLLGNNLVDYLQADVSYQGGYRFCNDVINATASHGKRFAFHNIGTDLETLIQAHLGVCFSEDVVPWLEHPLYVEGDRTFLYPFPLAREVLAEPLEIKDGRLLLPKGPGLGVRVNESVIRRYSFVPGPWSVVHLSA